MTLRKPSKSDATRLIDQLVATGIPLSALALYSRWWALETWLRELTYIELRGELGPSWTSIVSARAGRRQDHDERFDYMLSSDSANLLAYEDVGILFELIKANWRLFEPCLLPTLRRWEARTDELLQIRHRMGHCRRPHKDDIGRVEQTLRDLESGAWKAVTTYNDSQSIPKALDDPVVEAWIRDGCSDAKRLKAHAERNYDTSLFLEYSARPWATQAADDPIAGRKGFFWYVRFVMRGVHFRPQLLPFAWNEESPLPECVVHMLAEDPAHIRFTISALEDPEVVIAVIGQLFDTVLTYSAPYPALQALDDDTVERTWRENLVQLGHRAQSTSALAIVTRGLPRCALLLPSSWSG